MSGLRFQDWLLAGRLLQPAQRFACPSCTLQLQACTSLKSGVDKRYKGPRGELCIATQACDQASECRNQKELTER
eukprot:1157608-Pelagomonas_calceolata.AAC.4